MLFRNIMPEQRKKKTRGTAENDGNNALRSSGVIFKQHKRFFHIFFTVSKDVISPKDRD